MFLARARAGLLPRPPSLAAALARPAAAPAAALARPAAAPAAAPAARPYMTMTKRRRKELRKEAAARTREVLAFAAAFDPPRAARRGVARVLERLGYDCRPDEAIGEGLVVDYALSDWYAAVAVVDAERWVLPTDARASTDAGWGPGVPPRGASDAPPGAPARLPSPAAAGFGSAPPPWLNPARGLVLDAATAAGHAAVRAKGWKLAVVPAPLWEFAATKPHDAAYATRDLLLSLLLPLVPFDARAGGGAPGGGRAAAGAAGGGGAGYFDGARAGAAAGGAGASAGAGGLSDKARARAGRLTESEAAAEVVDRAAGSARGRAALDEAVARAETEAFAGRSRKARRMGRAKVEAADAAARAERDGTGRGGASR